MYIIQVYIMNIMNHIKIVTLLSPLLLLSQNVASFKTTEGFMCNRGIWEKVTPLFVVLLRLKCQVKIPQKRRSPDALKAGRGRACFTPRPGNLLLKINGGKPTESQHFHRNILQFLLYAFCTERQKYKFLFRICFQALLNRLVEAHTASIIETISCDVVFRLLADSVLFLHNQTRKIGKCRELFSVTEKGYNSSVNLQESLFWQYVYTSICIFKINPVFSFDIINTFFFKYIA